MFIILFVLGLVIGTVANSFLFWIPAIIIAIPGGFAAGASMTVATSVFDGTVWGVRFNSSDKAKKLKKWSIFGLILAGYALSRIVSFEAIFNGGFLTSVMSFFAYFVCAILGIVWVRKHMTKILSQSTNFLPLGGHPLFKEIDENMEQAASFIVSFEGIALFSNTNYCYAVYFYEDYQLGSLATPQEVALVGSYFVQKYHDKYTFKVDMEVIPGEPGQTAVAVGTGGVTYIRTSGTPTQRNFRSYIFTKKQ